MVRVTAFTAVTIAVNVAPMLAALAAPVKEFNAHSPSSALQPPRSPLNPTPQFPSWSYPPGFHYGQENQAPAWVQPEHSAHNLPQNDLHSLFQYHDEESHTPAWPPGDVLPNSNRPQANTPHNNLFQNHSDHSHTPAVSNPDGPRTTGSNGPPHNAILHQDEQRSHAPAKSNPDKARSAWSNGPPHNAIFQPQDKQRSPPFLYPKPFPPKGPPGSWLLPALSDSSTHTNSRTPSPPVPFWPHENPYTTKRL